MHMWILNLAPLLPCLVDAHKPLALKLPFRHVIRGSKSMQVALLVTRVGTAAFLGPGEATGKRGKHESV